jgi:hypothetical protein
MTADQRLQLALAVIAAVGAVLVLLLGMGLRALWSLAQTLQEDRDATRANTVAIDKLTARVDLIDRGTRPRAR